MSLFLRPLARWAVECRGGGGGGAWLVGPWVIQKAIRAVQLVQAMQQHFDFSVGQCGGGVIHPRFQGINPNAQKGVPIWGAGPRVNLCEHCMRQLARTADHMTKPRGEERERAGIEDRISFASCVVPLSTRTGPIH